MTNPKWEDTTSYSRDKPRIQTAWSLKLSRDCVVIITKGHIYYPGEWVFHCRPWFDTHPLRIPADASPEEAQSAALAKVRGKVAELHSILRTIN